MIHVTPSELRVGDVILAGYAIKTKHRVTRIEKSKPGMLLIYTLLPDGAEMLYAKIRASSRTTFAIED